VGHWLALTAALPLAAGFTTLGWEISEVLGFAAALVFLALCGCSVRPRESVPPVLLSPSRHELLGWIALAAAALHVLAAVVTDHTVLEYLKPTTPLYQWAGSPPVGLARPGLELPGGFAAAPMAQPSQLSGYPHRRGCLGLVFLAAARGHGRPLHTGLWSPRAFHCRRDRRYRDVTTPPAWYGNGDARDRRDAQLRIRAAFDIRRECDPSTLLALTPLIAGRAEVALREPLLRRSMTLPLDFDHGKHTAVNCLACHTITRTAAASTRASIVIAASGPTSKSE